MIRVSYHWDRYLSPFWPNSLELVYLNAVCVPRVNCREISIESLFTKLMFIKLGERRIVKDHSWILKKLLYVPGTEGKHNFKRFVAIFHFETSTDLKIFSYNSVLFQSIFFHEKTLFCANNFEYFFNIANAFNTRLTR